jgi:hypothetical protein
MMGKGKYTVSSLQIAKTAIYLPAIAVTASGAQIFKKQAKGEPHPFHLVRYLRQFTGRGRRVAPFDKALAHLEPAEKDLGILKDQMDIITQFWLQVDATLEDIETRANELRNDNMLQFRMQNLKRYWKNAADDYKAYKSAVCILRV